MKRSDPSALAWLVGNELRQVRQRQGETQAAAADVVGCSTSRMNYLESGRTVQQPDDVRTLMKFYDAPAAEADRLASLLENPIRRTWWSPWAPVIPDEFRLFVGLEGFATDEFNYVPLIIPGMLQTSGYIAALISGGPVAALRHSRVIEFRQVRQQRLVDTDPLQLAVVIEEDALNRPVGGVDVMRGQLDHLLEMAERPNVTVQVMPRAVAVHDGLPGAFTLLDFEATQSIGYVDYPDGSDYVPDYHTVAGYLYRKDRLQADAMGAAESKEVIAARRAALD